MTETSSAVYLDSSVVISRLFKEPVNFKWSKLKGKTLFSSTLLYYEVMAASKREGVSLKDANALIASVNIISPPHILVGEVKRVLSVGYLRGADLAHVATALWISRDEPSNLYFLSFDNAQMKLAGELGFSEV